MLFPGKFVSIRKRGSDAHKPLSKALASCLAYLCCIWFLLSASVCICVLWLGRLFTGYYSSAQCPHCCQMRSRGEEPLVPLILFRTSLILFFSGNYLSITLYPESKAFMDNLLRWHFQKTGWCYNHFPFRTVSGQPVNVFPSQSPMLLQKKSSTCWTLPGICQDSGDS